MSILEYIGTGRKNARTRAELAALTGMQDRAVRNEIRRLRCAGVPIVSLSQYPGYWLAENVSEVEAMLREYDTRARSGRRDTAKLRRLVAEKHGYRMVEVKGYTRRAKRAPPPSGAEVEQMRL